MLALNCGSREPVKTGRLLLLALITEPAINPQKGSDTVMDRKLVLNFNAAYAAEAAPEEKQLVNDLLVVWGKLEPAAAKNPALIRKGVLFGMSLQKAITEGRIILPEVRVKRQANKPQQEGQ